MKEKIRIALLLFVLFLFVKCYKCYNCISDGENFNLPYSNQQEISFINSNNQISSYIVSKSQHLPPNEYCGQVGSESYGDCSGSASTVLKSTQNNKTAIIISYNTQFSDDVNMHIEKKINVLNAEIYIYNNKATTNEKSSVKTNIILEINNIKYTNVYLFETDTSNVKLGDCFSFYYQLDCGLLKYSVKNTNGIETWTIK